ncbi:MAG: Spy/CpxP family protein refolding chaperone [Hyphomicrobium sp.]|uniref:Spy/CpxP family protein refolding chaperone n=1 Tax=Hyphomicrobium sp. TaxID=82 RepID=UPI001327430D|nr:Spy/CpxP family protein refolding chaperone [Hyphomicrobium sp.]KAB2942297.1 MAG: Spy/CpxP family protein refolding chaperone [Hyphomicrobium sp.]MBZ0209261.1 Spy/CpxP family protein refolding chaperone [Hyphomicrobium sp.]
MRDTRATYVKAQLGITDAQATTWNAYLAAFRKHLTAMQQHHQAMMTAMGAGTTSAQRAEALVASMDACHDAMKELKTAYVALYQALTPEQKQKADALFIGMSWMM